MKNLIIKCAELKVFESKIFLLTYLSSVSLVLDLIAVVFISTTRIEWHAINFDCTKIHLFRFYFLFSKQQPWVSVFCEFHINSKLLAISCAMNSISFCNYISWGRSFVFGDPYKNYFKCFQLTDKMCPRKWTSWFKIQAKSGSSH